ncbi:hypothetical protein [Anaerorhabdus sp.]|uniref:hypothetical protein n=1 Tax=Anaerorhabdus sp. TaxID=1872524 RepID=UPI002FCA9651
MVSRAQEIMAIQDNRCLIDENEKVNITSEENISELITKFNTNINEKKLKDLLDDNPSLKETIKEIKCKIDKLILSYM